MLNLIRNENTKIYRRMRTWVMFIILAVIVVGMSYLMQNYTNRPDPSEWKQTLISQNTDIKAQIAEKKDVSEGVMDYYKETLATNEYRLTHDIAPLDYTVWGNLLELANMIMLVTIFTVIVAADSIAGEYSTGTIKLLLVRPHSRGKVLLSKYIASLLFSLGMLVFLFVLGYVTNGILCGFEGTSLPYVYMSADGVVHQQSTLLHVLSTYGLSSVTLLMTVTLAFTISTVFRSSSLSIGLSMAIMFLSDTFINALSQYSWIKYYLFANTHLMNYVEGTPLRADMTLSFSITVLAVYFVVLNLLSWTVFSRRDVAA